MESDKTRIFVYGSLKKGYGNYDYFLRNADFVSNAVTKEPYKMYSLGGFPGVVKDAEVHIKGELYDVDVVQLARIDRLEGHPTFYERELIETNHGPAWMYFLTKPDNYIRNKVVESGVW